MARGRVRICPFCGTEGMVLALGGLGGAMYRCSNCQYTGPVSIEEVREVNTGDESRELSASMMSLNRNLNWAGLLFGLAFMTIGTIAWFLPAIGVKLPSSGGPQFLRDSALAILVIGGMLVVVSGAFWFFERPGAIDRPS